MGVSSARAWVSKLLALVLGVGTIVVLTQSSAVAQT
jgi:hypothetical protein